MIHVSFCINDTSGNYIRHTAAAIVSIFENTKNEVTIHLVHDETLTVSNRILLETMVGKYKQHILFYEVDSAFFSQIAKKIKRVVSLPFSIETLYRLKIAELLNVDQVLYLDSDIIVNEDLTTLWKKDISDYYCAAVLDVKSTRKKITNKRHFKKIGIKPDKYFNAGVILFNLKKIRKELNLFNTSVELLIKYSSDIIFFDQDVLNRILQKNTLLLPFEFNFIPAAEYAPTSIKQDDLDKQRYIIHFAGAKPWNYHSCIYDWLYWKYLSKTPWGDTAEKIVHLQKNLGIDLGYALSVGKIVSRKMLIKSILSYF